MRTLVYLIGIAAVVFAAASGAAELYKWVDERGVTNYSSDPPPKGRAAKPIAEDLVSVYTPEAAVMQAIEAERHRRAARPPASAAPATPPPPPAPTASTAGGVIAPPVKAAPYDPCLTGNDPNCYAPTIYDTSPVFVGRQRRPVLNQPQLPPGAIAGNVTGTTGVAPGLSGLAPPVTPPPPPRRNPRERSSTWRELSP